jgi:hypothetical protein
VYAQQKADEELNSLLKSEAPGAGAKAFAQGLVAGTAAPLVMNAIPWAAQVGTTIQGIQNQAHVASLLQSGGMPEPAARQAAAGVLQYLNHVDPLSGEAREALSEKVFSWAPRPQLQQMLDSKGLGNASLQETIDVLRSHPGLKNVSQEQILAGYFDKKPVPLASGGRPSAATRRAVLETAQQAFEEAGGKVPIGRELARSFGLNLKASLPIAAALGLAAGLGSYQAHRGRKKELEGLRKKAEDSLTDRALAAAPGLAAVPGFAIGATNPQAFNPRGLFPSVSEKFVQSKKGRLVSGLLGAGAFATTGWLPAALRDTGRALMPQGKPADTTTAPIVIKKQAAALPHMLDELHKIGASNPAVGLGLKPTPWDLGIHAKKTDQDHRGIAYTSGVGSAAAAGVPAAGAVGLVAGRPLVSLRKRKAREAALEEASKDIAKLVGAGTEAKARFYAEGGTEAAQALYRARLGKDVAEAAGKGTEAGVSAALKSLKGKGLDEIAKRRGKAALRAGASGALLFGGAKALSNIGKYHTARGLATDPKKTRTKK